jgi:hypothetical protein
MSPTHRSDQPMPSAHADTARRIAERYELLDAESEATYWWHKAADLGDPDARDYVDKILT